MGEQHQCVQEARIRALEAQQVETGVYLKVIREDVSEIKQTLKQRPALQGGGWPQVVSDLIKLVMLALLILGGIAGVTKLISMGGGGIP